MEQKVNLIKVPEEISVREFFEMFKDALQLELLAGDSGLDRMITSPASTAPHSPLPAIIRILRQRESSFSVREKWLICATLANPASARFWMK